MKRLTMVGLALAVALPLGGCANLRNAWSVVTNASVSPKAVAVAASAFDAVEKTAGNYIAYCSPNPAPVGCNDAVIQTNLIPAIKSGVKARDALEAFQKAHPGALGDKGVYDALTTATSTISAIVANFKG